jgi:dipeptidyl aminopeptidase/acylaminoacyl peptidase
MPHWHDPHDVAWLGDQLLTGPITGVVLTFHGLGGTGLKEGPDPFDEELSALGALAVYPYYGPWSWMNREARAFVDDLIEAIYREHGLDPARVPLVLTGGSMGGYSALMCARYTRHHPVACYANCPATDLAYHFGERPDLPRTIYNALGAYDGVWEDLLAEHSPLRQVVGLPDIDYLIVHGEEDPAVLKSAHSDPQVAAMRARGLRVEYLEVPGMGHCGPLPPEVSQRIHEFLERALTPPL